MPAAPGLTTIQCPQCNQSLPPGAMRCQFCGADLSHVARPAHAVAAMRAQAKARSTAPSWQEVAFQIIAGLWVLNAVFEILQGLGVIPGFLPSPGFKEVLIVMGIIDVILGLGMWFQNDLAMTVIKYRCIIGLLHGLLGLMMAFVAPTNAMVALIVIVNVVYLAFTGFQIYILSLFSD